MVTAINQCSPLGFNRGDADRAALPVAEFIKKPVDFRVLCDKLDRLLRRPTIATQENR